MGVESFLDQEFYNHAKELEKEMKGKSYKYKLYDEDYFDPKLVSEGICIIRSRSYSKSLDCDVMVILDVNLNKTFNCNQFNITLDEIK